MENDNDTTDWESAQEFRIVMACVVFVSAQCLIALGAVIWMVFR